MILVAIAAYFVIGAIVVAVAIYLGGSLELQHVPWVPLMVVIWPALVLVLAVTVIRDYFGDWWSENKYREIWRRK